MGFEDAAGNIPPNRGTLYKLNDTGCFQNLDPILPGVSVSNGLAWNENGTRMYYIDSPTKQIVLFDYDPSTASICNFFFYIFYSLFDNSLIYSKPQNIL
jgi:sugar lactone lactonase YvrE